MIANIMSGMQYALCKNMSGWYKDGRYLCSPATDFLSYQMSTQVQQIQNHHLGADLAVRFGWGANVTYASPL